MDFNSALLRGLDHRKTRNTIIVAPEGKRTNVQVQDSRKGLINERSV